MGLIRLSLLLPISLGVCALVQEFGDCPPDFSEAWGLSDVGVRDALDGGRGGWDRASGAAVDWVLTLVAGLSSACERTFTGLVFGGKPT